MKPVLKMSHVTVLNYVGGNETLNRVVAWNGEKLGSGPLWRIFDGVWGHIRLVHRPRRYTVVMCPVNMTPLAEKEGHHVLLERKGFMRRRLFRAMGGP
jgi:hypothetical protein